MNNEILILLPDTIYITKSMKHQAYGKHEDEFNIYFKNTIYPYKDEWDIVVNCEVGANLGRMWRVVSYSDEKSEFDFELIIYNEYGERLASKKSKLVFVERLHNPEKTTWMPVGDSMTRAETYIRHTCHKLHNVETVGIRSVDGIIHHEGRGGWAYRNLYESYFFEMGISPFLFPKGIAAKDFYGNMEFMNELNSDTFELYCCQGFKYEPISDGQYFIENKMLYRLESGEKKLISEKPEFDFDFEKYLERYHLEAPKFVSLLMGANDLQICDYEESESRIEKYIENTKKFAQELHRVDKNIKIIICLPVTGAEQYCWGTQLNCIGGEKRYRFNIMHACRSLIDEFDNRQKENIYLAPMLFALDPQFGFDYMTVKANMYSEKTVTVQANWVHPNNAGYCQMGDSIAAVIEYARKK